ncbi:MAG TPA: PilZ domain-containing protein, partial [Kofleriaceae bacterium]|nr:PilZ domain-containing protein [Kofleriaceae bacterium]
MGSSVPARARPPLPPGAERRRHERFELLAQVEVRRMAEVSVLPVANISAGGMLVRLEGNELRDVS